MYNLKRKPAKITYHGNITNHKWNQKEVHSRVNISPNLLRGTRCNVVTDPCPQIDESSKHPQTPFHEDSHFPLIYAQFLRVIFSLQVSQSKFCMHFSLPACVFDMLKQSILVPAVLTERIRQHVPAKQLVICRPSLSKNAEAITHHWNLTNGRRWNLISSQQTTLKTISKQTETCTVMQWNKHKDLDMYILCLYVHNHTRCACAYNRYVAHYERWPVWRIFCLNFEPSFQNFVELLGPRGRTITR